MVANSETGQGFWVDWYPCAPRSDPLPFGTVYSSSNWLTVDERLNTALGEVYSSRRYLKKNGAHPPGRKPCGTAAQFSGETPFSRRIGPTGDVGAGGFAQVPGSRNLYGQLTCCGGLPGPGAGVGGSALMKHTSPDVGVLGTALIGG
jgi:hypothetical protein